MAKYLDASGVSTLWSKAKNTFASLSHTHIKITHSFWSYSDAISEDATPKEIGDYFGIPTSSYNAVFTAVTKNSSGSRWQNLYWTNYGEAGLVELGKSYGGGRLRYRIATGWNNGEKSWSSDGFKYLATTDDLTWGSISGKPFSSGTDSLGVYFEGTSNTGIRMQYYRGSSLGYDQILLKDGVLKFNNQTVYHSGNLNPSSFSLASHNHDTNYAKINAYTLPSQKGVRITYNSYSPVIVSVCGSNSGAQLVIIGTGYGGGGRVRNQFTELVSCSLFDWCIPNSESILCSVEIYSRRNSDSTVTVIGSDYVVFTVIDSLTSTKENATLLNSSNYTSWAAASNHTHTLESLGAASSSHNHDDVYSKLGHTHSYLPLSGGTLTGNITTSAFMSGHDGAGVYFEGNYSDGFRIQYPKTINSGSRSNYDTLRLAAGELKFNNNLVYHAGNANLTSVRWNARSLFVNNYGASGNIGVASVIINKGGDLYGLGNDPGNISNIAIGTTTDTNGTWKNILLTIDGSGNTTISGGLTIGGNTAIHTGNYTSYCAAVDHTHSNYSTTSHQHNYLQGYSFYSAPASVIGEGHSALPVDWAPHQIMNTVIPGNTTIPYVFAAFSEPSYKNSLFWTGYGKYGLTELRSGYGGTNTRLQYRVSSGYSSGNPTWGEFHTLAWTDDIPSAMTNTEIDNIMV